MNTNNTTLILGSFIWDTESKRLERDQKDFPPSDRKEITLTPKQFRLLQCLYKASPHVLQRKEIVDFVWESKPTSPESLPQLIHRTRIVLEDCDKSILVNEPGVGYSLNFVLRVDDPVEESAPQPSLCEEEVVEKGASTITKIKPLDWSVKLILPILICFTAINLGSALEAFYYAYEFRGAFFAEPYPQMKPIDSDNIAIVIDKNECTYTKSAQLLKCS